MGLFKMKDGVKELPGNKYNLPERISAEKRARRVEVNKRFIYLLLVAGFACFHNLCAAAGDGAKLPSVKDCPVNIRPSHNSAESHGDISVISGNSATHGGANGFFDLLFKELNSAAPGQTSPGQVDDNNNKRPILTQLSTNIDKLCHILLAYFIPAVMFFISIPAILFYWARGSLKMDREAIKVMEYNFSEVKNQAPAKPGKDTK